MKLNWFFCKDSSHQEEGQPILCYCLTGEVVAFELGEKKAPAAAVVEVYPGNSSCSWPRGAVREARVGCGGQLPEIGRAHV